MTRCPTCKAIVLPLLPACEEDFEVLAIAAGDDIGGFEITCPEGIAGRHCRCDECWDPILESIALSDGE